MLQQTQVSTVLARYYFPFLERFPTITHLAKASRQEVLKAWEGLGYYRRAGYLHEAAKLSVEGGLNPLRASVLTPAASGSPSATQDLLNSLLSLPGIGQNTAHAILAFAHHQPVPVLEANVKRVVARIFAREKDNDLWQEAATLLNRKTPFDYNQAMMDLGSMICTPKAPLCGECPANIICNGKTAPELYPARKVKKASPTRQVTIMVMEDAAGKLFLEARKDALLGGLYGFPQSPQPKSPSPKIRRRILTSPGGRGKQEARPRPTATSPTGRGQNSPLGEFWERAISGEGTLIGHITHIYTHFRLEGVVRYMRIPDIKNSTDWRTREEIAALPLSRLDHKVLALLAPAAEAA